MYAYIDGPESDVCGDVSWLASYCINCTALLYNTMCCTAQVTIRRAQLMDDAYRGLAGMGRDLRARLSVTFVNEAGLRCAAQCSLQELSQVQDSKTWAECFKV